MNITNKNALPVGTVIHQYKIESMLAYGGFGIVYLARHQQLDMQVVIKEYLPSEIATREGTTVHPLGVTEREDYEDGLARFLDEAKQLVQFQKHPNIVSCRDFFSENGTAYLVMDYEEGLALNDLLKARNNEPLNEQDLLRVMRPLLDGLAYVHGRGVLHRDIKPQNIYIKRNDEQPILIDFGAAKQNFSKHSKSMAPYTEGYASSEQVSEHGELGPWTDLYAIGAVMWRIISGKNPVKVENRMAATIRGKEDPVTSAVALGKGRYSEFLLKAIDKCLALNDEDRYQSVQELQQDLGFAEQTAAPVAQVAPAIKQAPFQSTQSTNAQPGNKKPVLIAAAAAAVLLVAGIGTYLVFDAQQAEQEGQRQAEQDRIEQQRKHAEEQTERDRVDQQRKQAEADAERRRIEKRAADERQRKLEEKRRQAEIDRQRKLEQQRKAEADRKRLEDERRRAETEHRPPPVIQSDTSIYKRHFPSSAEQDVYLKYKQSGPRASFLKVKAPDIAENGSVVPVQVIASKPIRDLYVFVDGNPQPVAARLTFKKLESGVTFQTRVKMRGSNKIIAVADSGDGVYRGASKHVRVTIPAKFETETRKQTMALRARGNRNTVKILITSPSSRTQHVNALALTAPSGIRLATVLANDMLSKNPYIAIKAHAIRSGQYYLHLFGYRHNQGRDKVEKTISVR